MQRLETLDAMMATGSWTDHDAKTFGGLNNALRLALRKLGFGLGRRRIEAERIKHAIGEPQILQEIRQWLTRSVG